MILTAKKEVIVTPPAWWERCDHPMSDGEFVNAFCAHVLVTTTDHSLVTLRNRGYHFIRNFMLPTLTKQLAEYRKVHL